VQGWMYHGNVLATLGHAIAARSTKVCWNIRQTSASLGDDKLLTRGLILSGGPLSRFCCKIIYNSAIAATQHERYGYDANKRQIIHNGIDAEEFRPNSASRDRVRRLFKLPLDAIVIGRFGRFAAMKDHRTMLRAFGILAAQDPRRHLLVIGPGISPGNPDLAGWVRETGAADRVHLFGARMDLPQIMPGVDVTVSSSRSSEGFPNVLAEGMACGVPAVATDVGESRLIVEDASRIVPAGDASLLADAVGSVLAMTDEQRLALGIRDRTRIVEKFSARSMVAKYLETWTECVG